MPRTHTHTHTIYHSRDAGILAHPRRDKTGCSQQETQHKTYIHTHTHTNKGNKGGGRKQNRFCPPAMLLHTYANPHTTAQAYIHAHTHTHTLEIFRQT